MSSARTRSRPFSRKTGWLAAAVVGAAALLACAWLASSRVVAYRNAQNAFGAAAKGDYATAATLMSRAAERWPRYKNDGHYLRGIHLAKQRQYGAAVKELEQAAGAFENDRVFQTMLLSARMNAAWFADDYVAYLRHAEAMVAFRPEDPQAVLGVAAGNAYRYAQTGREDFRRRSEESLVQLAAMQPDQSLDERIARVRRCLETRVIPPH